MGPCLLQLHNAAANSHTQPPIFTTAAKPRAAAREASSSHQLQLCSQETTFQLLRPPPSPCCRRFNLQSTPSTAQHHRAQLSPCSSLPLQSITISSSSTPQSP
ncbi:hypothetical protein M0R45_007983 [Rubus argutus]|uniref:Uncharacterized protein n=1 Tax=Rubus argutus TaxID=59490 RepID=A0AAW1Y1G5_RUBAR